MTARLDAARLATRGGLLDQKCFFLDAADFDSLLQILSEPPKPSDDLVALLKSASQTMD